jgi:tRNA dimethylallyltransferase
MEWPCIVIAGPTATGKTALAVDVAHALGSEIFSMDSRQVYRGLDLGTGKDLEEYQRVTPAIPYHLIDIVEPSEVYSLFRFQADCYAALEEFRKKKGNNTPPILVGGTGLYLEAILKRYDIAQVPENPALRAELSERNLEDLTLELGVRSPELRDRTDLSNKRRVVRALEIALSQPTGEIPRSRLPEWTLKPVVFVTQWDRAALHTRIAERLQARLAAGMVEEVQHLRDKGLSWDRLNDLGMEYRQIAALLRGEKTRDAMETDLLHEIRQLAKRQETWFRGMERRGIQVHFINPQTTTDDILAQARDYL